MIVVAHPTGNRNVRSVLAALLEAGLLGEFATTLAFDQSAAWLRYLPAGMRGELLRRSYDIPPGAIHRRPWREMMRMVAGKIGWARLIQRETGWASVDAIYRDLDRHVATRLPELACRGVRGVYAYEGGAATAFTAARNLGMCVLYDLPIAYWQTAQRLLKEEAARLPAWERTLSMSHHAEEFQRKTEEMQLADVVFCPSQFVADSIPASVRGSKRIVVAHFGSPVGAIETASAPAAPARDPGRLRVLFAGSMGQRKGLGDLFAALQRLKRNDIELVVIGSLLAPMEFYREQYPKFIYENTRPHAEVLRLMQSCDVFVLPSIFEGRALVMQEAMSQGLPLLITANTGGEDLVEPERTGFLVPIRSPDAIAGRLAWFADHRDETRAMGGFARAKAAEYTWANYGAKIVGAIGSALKA